MDAASRYPLPDEEEEQEEDAGAHADSPPPTARHAATATAASATANETSASVIGQPDLGGPPEWGNYVAENERGDSSHRDAPEEAASA
jgi:hypothetical protein